MLTTINSQNTPHEKTIRLFAILDMIEKFNLYHIAHADFSSFDTQILQLG